MKESDTSVISKDSDTNVISKDSDTNVIAKENSSGTGEDVGDLLERRCYCQVYNGKPMLTWK